jgi:hypothetical protein
MVAFGGEPRPPRLLRLAAAAAACWTVASVWLASAEFRGFMRLTNPGVYRAVGHALDLPSDWWARAAGVRYGPVDLVIRVPPGAPPEETVLVASGRPQRSNQLVLQALGGGRFRLALDDNQHPVLETPPLEARDGVLRVRVSAPWLYPPPEHPYWDRVADPGLRDDLQHRFAVDWGAGRAETHSALSSDPVSLEPAVRWASPDRPATPFVESLAREGAP